MNNPILSKTKDESFFVKSHHTAPVACRLFEPIPRYDGKEVIILQIMDIDDGHLIFECIFKR